MILGEKKTLPLRKSRTELMKKSITNKGSILWNNLRSKNRDLDGCSTYKNSLKE